MLDCPGDPVVKNPPASAEDMGSLVQEDSTCHGAAKPVRHNYCSSHTLEPRLLDKRSHCSEKPRPVTSVEKVEERSSKTNLSVRMMHPLNPG